MNPLAIWKGVKNVLPPIVTGASDETIGNEAPAEALYNLIFVRTPTIVVGILYFQRISGGGNPIFMDLGLGSFELSPLLVLMAMWLILRPA